MGRAPELKKRGDRRPRTCRESSRKAAWKSCLSGAGGRRRLRRPGPRRVGAGTLLSSRAAPGRILPGPGAGPRRGPRRTPGPRPQAPSGCGRGAAGGTAQSAGQPWEGGRRARARGGGRGWPPAPRLRRGSRRGGSELRWLRRPPLLPRPALPGGDPTPRPATRPQRPSPPPPPPFLKPAAGSAPHT